MKIELYTAQECEFLDKCLNLLEVEAKVTEVKDVISYTLYEIEADDEALLLIKRCMAYNYKKNFM